MFFLMSGLLHVYMYLYKIIYTTLCLGAYPYVFMFASPFYREIHFFLCIRLRVCLRVHGYMSVRQVFNKGKMFTLFSTLTA